MENQKASRKKGMIVVYFLFILIPVIWFLFLKQGSDHEVASKALHGIWLRSDGNYTIEIKDFQKEGRVVATYFNQNLINVKSASWQLQDNTLEIYVEMDDVNYRESNY